MDSYFLPDVPFKTIVARLQNGATIIYPTETCYGLGCIASDQQAVDTVYQIKQRQREKSLLVLMEDIAMAKQYVQWNADAQRLADQYWPGPLTLVLPTKPGHGLARGVVAEDGTLAFRVTAHTCSQQLVAGLGAPLVSTSANMSAQASAYEASDVQEMVRKAEVKPDMFINGGDLRHSLPSTIVRLRAGQVEVLRHGAIPLQNGSLPA